MTQRLGEEAVQQRQWPLLRRSYIFSAVVASAAWVVETIATISRDPFYDRVPDKVLELTYVGGALFAAACVFTLAPVGLVALLWLAARWRMRRRATATSSARRGWPPAVVRICASLLALAAPAPVFVAFRPTGPEGSLALLFVGYLTMLSVATCSLAALSELALWSFRTRRTGVESNGAEASLWRRSWPLLRLSYIGASIVYSVAAGRVLPVLPLALRGWTSLATLLVPAGLLLLFDAWLRVAAARRHGPAGADRSRAAGAARLGGEDVVALSVAILLLAAAVLIQAWLRAEARGTWKYVVLDIAAGTEAVFLVAVMAALWELVAGMIRRIAGSSEVSRGVILS